MNAPNGFMMKDEAASVLGCQRRTIDNLMKRRAIPFYKFGRRVLFKHEEILEAVRQSRVSSRSSMEEQSLYKRQVSGSSPDATTPDVEQAKLSWDAVIDGLIEVKQFGTPKQVNLANAVLKFINKFEL